MAHLGLGLVFHSNDREARAIDFCPAKLHSSMIFWWSDAHCQASILVSALETESIEQLVIKDDQIYSKFP